MQRQEEGTALFSDEISRRKFLGAAAAAGAGAAVKGVHGEAVAPRQSDGRLPHIVVHPDGHMLQTEAGAPFFWLGDTAWQLIQSTTREECSYYLQTRAQQGFNVVQAVVLAEYGGVSKPSVLGLQPFRNNDPAQPVDAFFDRVVEVVEEAARYGLYVAVLPAWGDKLTAPWGAGPLLFRNDNLPVARQYAEYLGRRLRGHSNVLWMLGGDRPARLEPLDVYLRSIPSQFQWASGYDWTPIWAAMAEGLATGWGRKPLIIYHPQGGRISSSVLLHDAAWLDVNGMQSGHGALDEPVWEMVAHDYAQAPARPTIDLEPNYEDHPLNPWPAWDPSTGYFRDYDVRKQTYRSVFGGGCGVTYGHHAVWQFACLRNGIVNYADRDWTDAMVRPGALQMLHLRRLVESRPFFHRIPDQSILVHAGEGGAHAQATRDREGTYLFAYLPYSSEAVELDVRSLRAGERRAWWYHPRTGIAQLLAAEPKGDRLQLKTPPNGPDWVFVLDSAASGYAPPGVIAPALSPA